MMDFDKIEEGGWEANINPRYVEVNFNHACNFACTYCSPQFSTTWGQEIDQHGAYPTIKEHNAPEHFTGRNRPVPAREENPYVDAFWKWWPDMYKDLKHFRMTGGEPMMDKNTYKVFDWVLANPKPDLHLNVTSNFCPPNEKLWDKYLDYVKRICAEENVEHFMNFVSVDSWGSQAEYLRRGLDFNRMWQHVDQFLTEIPGRNSITFIITYNNLSIVGIKKLLQGILELRKKHSKDYQRIWFDTPLLREPDWQNIQILPESYQMMHEQTIEWMKQNIETRDNRLHCIKDFEIQRMERDLAYMRKSSVDVHRKRADFWKFFKEYDKRHNHDIRKIFPEMQQFFDVCESEASKW
jgi:organic radical activating enzyme